MQSVLDYILSLFQRTFDLMKSTVFTVYGYKVSLFWLLLAITFMSLVFTVILPFVSRSYKEYNKATSERNDK